MYALALKKTLALSKFPFEQSFQIMFIDLYPNYYQLFDNRHQNAVPIVIHNQVLE